MKKINKKGFTLIELLAVIVVLALIMVLVLPNVMDSMNSAKQQTFLLYANRMLSAAMDKRASDELAGDAKDCYLISDLNNGNTNKYVGKVTYDTETQKYKISIFPSVEDLTKKYDLVIKMVNHNVFEKIEFGGSKIKDLNDFL